MSVPGSRISTSNRRTPASAGVFVAVAGPSGAGKDTLIAVARRLLAAEEAVLFVRRTVTRPAEPAGEDHFSLTEVEFDRARDAGVFALTWTAHGLSYGIPASVGSHLARGGVAVANVSRAVLPALALRYPDLVVINVTAPPEVLAERLAARGRESEAAIRDRIARAAQVLPSLPAAAVTIENTGSLDSAGALLAGEIRRAVARAAMVRRS